MRWTWPLLAVLPALTGCAGHAGTMADVRAALAHNDVEEARAILAEAGRGTDDLLFALEDGLLLHYAGDPQLSNERFQFAEARVDDLYTKSITRAALSLVASDLVLRFEPRGIENFLINYYRAINYLALGQPEEAWVEWRALATKLQFSRDQSEAPYLDPPFFNHLVGLGLELDDPSNAYASLRRAEAGYRAAGSGAPGDLVEDLVRLAGALGFADHVEEYESRYALRDSPSSGRVEPSRRDEAAYPPDWGEIVLLVEDGLVAPIEEVQVFIPITTERAHLVYAGDKESRLRLSESLAAEYGSGRYNKVNKRWRRRPEIAYVLPLSFPVFGQGISAVRRLEVAAAGDTVAGRVALDVSAMQGAAFDDRRLGMYAKTIARALVKSVAAAKLKEKAEEEGGEAAGDVVGVLANAVNVLTERADTRTWLGLPDRIWISRLRVPPGAHEVTVFRGSGSEVSLGAIEVRPGERRFVSYRVFY